MIQFLSSLLGMEIPVKKILVVQWRISSEIFKINFDLFSTSKKSSWKHLIHQVLKIIFCKMTSKNVFLKKLALVVHNLLLVVYIMLSNYCCVIHMWSRRKMAWRACYANCSGWNVWRQKANNMSKFRNEFVKKCNNALYKNIFAGETQHLGESNTKKFVHLIMNYYDY